MMSEWIHSLIQYVVAFAGAQPALVGLLLFIFSFSEGVAFIGATVPGESLVVAIAAVAGAAGGDPWTMLAWSALGAAVGDGISFWIGRTYGESIVHWPGIRSKPELLEKGHDFIRRHGAKSVAIARFLPVLRSIVPVAAGVFKMDAKRFYIANITSALAWAILHILPAATLGLAYKALGVVSERIAVIVLVAFALLVLSIWVTRIFVVKLAPHFMRLYVFAVQTLAKRSDSASKFLASILDPKRPGFTGLVVWSIVLLAAMIGFIGVLEDLMTGDPLVLADTAIHNFSQGLRSDPVDTFMVLVTGFGDAGVLVAVAATIVIVLVIMRAYRLALATLLLMLMESIFVPAMKLALHKSRPIDIYSGAEAFSFPSGHVTATTVIFGAFAVLVSRNIGARSKALLFSFLALWVVLVGISRIYLSAHWPSDVLGGMFFGAILTAIFALLHGQIQTPEYLGRYLGVSVLAVFIGFGGYHSWTSFGQNLERYAPQSTKQILALEDWRTGGWQDLPKQRIDLIGEQEEVFAYQWASSISEIDSALTHSGWTEADRFTWFEALKLFSPSIRLEDLAPLPILHDGRLPMATFYRADQSPDQSPDGRLVLRFWQTDYRVTHGSKAEPLLIASVSQEVLEHPVSWFAFMKEEQPSADISRGLLPAENTLNGISFQMIMPNAPALVWKLD